MAKVTAQGFTGRSNMLPCPSGHNIPNQSVRHAEIPSQLHFRNSPRSPQSANGKNCFICDFGKRMLFSRQILFWMPVGVFHTGRLSEHVMIRSALDRETALVHSVPHILSVRSSGEMGWVAARRIVAGVARLFIQRVNSRTEENGYAVGAKRLAGATHGKLPISPLMAATLPRPALFRPFRSINQTPEQSYLRFGKNGNRVTLKSHSIALHRRVLLAPMLLAQIGACINFNTPAGLSDAKI